MREGRHGHHGHGGHRGHEHEGRGKHRFQSAQTFRRGRAIAFLETLHIKRSTLLQQLNQPEYDAIKQVLSGELKAIDSIIQEFIHAFELREAPEEEELDQAATEQAANNQSTPKQEEHAGNGEEETHDNNGSH